MATLTLQEGLSCYKDGAVLLGHTPHNPKEHQVSDPTAGSRQPSLL